MNKGSRSNTEKSLLYGNFMKTHEKIRSIMIKIRQKLMSFSGFLKNEEKLSLQIAMLLSECDFNREKSFLTAF